MSRDISNSDDVIDSRSIIERIEELEALRDAVEEAKEELATAVGELEELQDVLSNASSELEEANPANEDEADLEENHKVAMDDVQSQESVIDRLQGKLDDAETEFDDDAQPELKSLQELAEECEGYASDWSHGETLIRDDHFVEYMEQQTKDIGDMPDKIPDYIVIDWEATADNLKADYASVDYDGVEYWIRCS